MSNLYGGPSTITASAGATSLACTAATPSVQNLWTLCSMSFVATGTSTAISLVGTGGDRYIGLDDVNVVLVSSVPEPGSSALMALGLAGLAVAARRRSQR